MALTYDMPRLLGMRPIVIDTGIVVSILKREIVNI